MVRVISTKPIWHSPESKTRQQQTSEETLQAQEQLLIQILENRQKDLREQERLLKQSLAGDNDNVKRTKKKKKQPSTNTNQIIIKTNIKPTMAKVEVTVKFSELPEAEPAENKKVKLHFIDDNDAKYSSLINKKSWNKAIKRVEEIQENNGDWIGAVAGKLLVSTEDNILTIVDAGIQIFEKKKKEIKEESSE